MEEGSATTFAGRRALYSCLLMPAGIQSEQTGTPLRTS